MAEQHTCTYRFGLSSRLSRNPYPIVNYPNRLYGDPISVTNSVRLLVRRAARCAQPVAAVHRTAHRPLSSLLVVRRWDRVSVMYSISDRLRLLWLLMVRQSDPVSERTNRMR